MWKYYALLSAFFAALTAIFAKIGVKDINSDLATAIRTAVILVITWGIALAGSHAGEVRNINGHTWLFLILSGAATGLSLTFRAREHYDIRFFLDYNLLPSHSRESHEWMNTLTLGSSFMVTL